MTQRMEVYGNKGGDYMRLSQSSKQEELDCLDIEVGCCCVVVLKAQIPVELLTLLIMDFMLKGDEGFSRETGDKLKRFAKELFTHSDSEYVDERLSQIKEYNCWGEEKYKEE